MISTDSYLPLLMIPIGIFFYLATRRASDLNILNMGVSISSNVSVGAGTVRVGGRLLGYATAMAREANDTMLAVRGMPVRLADVADYLSKGLGEAIHEHELRLAYGSRMFPDRRPMLHKGLVCVSNRPYVEACARALYEKSMMEGTIELNDRMDMSKFMQANGALCFGDLSLRALYGRLHAGRADICTCNGSETRTLECMESFYGRGNAKLLLFRLCHLIGVIEC